AAEEVARGRRERIAFEEPLEVFARALRVLHLLESEAVAHLGAGGHLVSGHPGLPGVARPPLLGRAMGPRGRTLRRSWGARGISGRGERPEVRALGRQSAVQVEAQAGRGVPGDGDAGAA